MPSPISARHSWRASYKRAGETISRTFPKKEEAETWLDAEGAPNGAIREKVVYRVRYQELGSEKWKSKTFPTKKAAKAWLEDAGGRKRRNRPVEASRELLKDYLERWLSAYVEGGSDPVRPNTAVQYRTSLETYIIPTLGKVPIGDLTVLDLRELYHSMAERGLSKRTITLANSVLRAALADAEDGGLVLANPAAKAIKRKRRGRRSDEEERNGENSSERKAMTPEQLSNFLAAAKEDQHSVLWHFLALTGCRPSEALALQWQDIDLEAATANVERSLCRAKGSWSFEYPKTESSARSLPLRPELVEMLKTHRAEVGRRRLGKGEEWKDLNLVFPGDVGDPLDYSALRRRHWSKILERAKLADVETIPAKEREKGKPGPPPREKKLVHPWYSPYSLRHTAASLMARAGIHPTVAAAVLGHTDVATTLRHYTHSEGDLNRKAVDSLAQLVQFPAKAPDSKKPGKAEA